MLSILCVSDLFLFLLRCEQSGSISCTAPVPRRINASVGGWNLIQVHFVHRHGHRTPGSTFPSLFDSASWDCNTANSNHSESLTDAQSTSFSTYQMPGGSVLGGNCSLGQLTGLGFDAARKTGHGIRQAYVEQWGLLPAQFDPNLYKIFSSPTPRSFQTGMAVFEGVYPPSSSRLSVHIATQDIANHNAYFWHAVFGCPSFPALVAAYRRSDAFRHLNKTVISPLVNQFAKALNRSHDVVAPIWDQVSPPLIMRRCAGFESPGTVTDDLLVQLGSALSAYLNGIMSMPGGLSMSAAPLFHAMWPFMLDAVRSSRATSTSTIPRFVQWAGHSETIAGLFFGFNCSNCADWQSPFMTHVTFELFKREIATKQQPSDQFAIRAALDGAVMRLPCSDKDGMCPWEDFQALVKVAVPADWRDVCLGTGTAK